VKISDEIVVHPDNPNTNVNVSFDGEGWVWEGVFVLFYHDGTLKGVLFRCKSGVIYKKKLMQMKLKLFKNMDNLS
jgi:hypothetical protein